MDPRSLRKANARCPLTFGLRGVPGQLFDGNFSKPSSKSGQDPHVASGP